MKKKFKCAIKKGLLREGEKKIEKLKPCPFCDAKAELDGRAMSQRCSNQWHIRISHKKTCYIYFNMGERAYYYPSRYRAIRAWNTRTEVKHTIIKTIRS